jgi:K319-like protein
MRRPYAPAVFPTIIAVALLGAATLPAADVLIDSHETWRFFRGRDPAPAWYTPPSAWRQPNFEDSLASGWEEGPTGIGYGDGDDLTVLDDMQMTATQAGYRAVFTRKTFQVPNPATIHDLTLVIDYDDAFIAYLNGQEVARRHTGTLGVGQDFAWNQSTGGDAHEAGVPERVSLSADIGKLVAGTNLLAVEIRNDHGNSSDLSFIPQLIANDSSLTCPDNFACPAVQGVVNLSWRNNLAGYDQITITRNGAAIPGSPFPGTAVAAQDTAPGILDDNYELVAVQEGSPCAPVTCTSTVAARGLGTLQCTLSLVNGTTQAVLTWTNIPNTVKAEVRREGELFATLVAGEEQYIDPNVESEQPEDDTSFEVKLFDAAGNTATMTCGAAISLCPTVTCSLTKVGGVDRVRLTFGNLVKLWSGFTVMRTDPGMAPVIVSDTIPGTATEFVDESLTPELGVLYTYTLHPEATVNPVTTCDRTCTFMAPIPETGDYQAPAGGWDYSINFEALSTIQYNSLPGETGNIDGRWIRSLDRDFWDGSAPDDVGPTPDGPAPGGIDLVSRPGFGPCGGDIKTLRILDPGNPAAPAGSSLATAYPDPFTDPSNKSILLAVDAGVATENLLRTGVTFACRWRITPESPAYMAAGADGDGQGIVDGALGNVGFLFRNNNLALPSERASACASFAMNSGNQLQFSANPVETLTSFPATTFHALWVTVEDPQNDGTYEVKTYVNGRTQPFSFPSAGPLNLGTTTFDFGAQVGNYLAIGMPDVGNDGVIEIDFVGYKKGVHPPSVTPCTGATNNRPTARIGVTPASRQVQLSGGAAQVNLDGRNSDDGDGGSQGLAFAWSKVSGPAGAAIVSPTANATNVNFTVDGTFVFRLTVDDRQATNNIATLDVTITVLKPSSGGGDFRRGDVDGSGVVELTDVINLIGFLFLGDPKTLGCGDAADVDDTGVVELTDAIVEIGWLFLGDPKNLPAPGALACGPDGDPSDSLPACGACQ